MLSCDDVREQLEAIETGEPAPGDVRDHLASCEPCRTEAARVRADMETLRGELASLAPSPFLEDAVLEAARATPSDAGGRGLPWLPAALGVAAALLLAVVVWLAKQPGEPQLAAGEGAPFGKDAGGPSLIAFPPTPVQVAAQRKERRAEAGGEVKLQFYRMAGAPPPGMVVVGHALLAQLARDGESVEVVLDRARKVDRNLEFDLTLGAPGWKGAACRVRARMVEEYSGNLIVPETLARALGLHEHERPVRITVGGDTSMAGERARAQVKIGGHDLETDVEVLREGVTLPAHPLHSGGLPQAMRIVIEGERPDSGSIGDDIDIHHAHGTSFIVATRVVGFGTEGQPARLDVAKAGPYQTALQYNAGTYRECLVFLPSLDFGGGGVLAWAFRMERVNLKQAFEPGAMVTIARVWRGRTAIPSRESVAHTWADEKGRVSFVHQRGERGPLRAREVRKDGTVHWHELARAATPKPKRRPLVLHPDGRVVLAPWDFQLWTPEGAATPDAASLSALREKLRVLADAAGRDDLGNSKLTLPVVAYPEAAWKRIETLLLACTHPTVRVVNLEFGFPSDDDGTPYRLPLDQAIGAIKMETAAFEVRAHWQGTDLHWKTSGVVGVHAGPLDDSEKGLAALEAVIRAARPDPNKRWYAGTINPVAAMRRRLPYGALRKLIQTLQAGGTDQVLLQNTPPRRKR